MTTLKKTKFEKSDDQMNIDKYIAGANITEYNRDAEKKPTRGASVSPTRLQSSSSTPHSQLIRRRHQAFTLSTYEVFSRISVLLA